ncbi:MAG: threonine/serine exporter family protein [Polyangiaceae bacterium]|nr:threonine/serine exporter family protein [Polyangiaceae bacterium]
MSAEVEVVDRFLVRLTTLLLRTSAEGSFEIRDQVRSAGEAYGCAVHLSILAESAVIVITHPDGSKVTESIHTTPELSRLDQVTEVKFLLRRVIDGTLPADDADRALERLVESPRPYPPWQRLLGLVLFSAGFAPSVQATWRELAISIGLGAIMAVIFIVSERDRRLQLLLPIVGPAVVGIVAFTVFDAAHAPGGPVVLMLPALFVLIPGDFLCVAMAELATGQITPGAVRLAHSLFTLIQLTAGIVIAAEIAGVNAEALFATDIPSALPYWLVAASWVPFTVGLMLTFDARIRDFGWMVSLVYLAWGVQQVFTAGFGPVAGTFVAGAVLAATGGILERSPARPPRLIMIIAGFFALTVGALALRGFATLDGSELIAGFNDVRNAFMQATALTIGLVLGTLATAHRPDRARKRAPATRGSSAAPAPPVTIQAAERPLFAQEEEAPTALFRLSWRRPGTRS